jgi:hypothetical protein
MKRVSSIHCLWRQENAGLYESNQVYASISAAQIRRQGESLAQSKLIVSSYEEIDQVRLKNAAGTPSGGATRWLP